MFIDQAARFHLIILIVEAKRIDHNLKIDEPTA